MKLLNINMMFPCFCRIRLRTGGQSHEQADPNGILKWIHSPMECREAEGGEGKKKKAKVRHCRQYLREVFEELVPVIMIL